MEKTNILGSIIGQLGPLDDHSIQLINLTAVLATKSDIEIENQIISSLENGIEPSMIYHTIMSVSETIGISKALNSLEIAERAVNNCITL